MIKENQMKRLLALTLVLLTLALGLAGCGAKDDAGEPTRLSFAESASLDALRALNGKKVTITGYMATLSPLDGSYIYLMNLPYQSCPFCVPNTQQLANTMAVYAAKGAKFDFTDRPVRVTGTLKLEDVTDDYGYEYNYRIVDAKYETVNLSEVSHEYALYQALAEDGVIADVNAMFDYLMFICQWTEYQGSYTDEAGNVHTYFLYPGDVEMYLEDEGPYGYAAQAAADYFPSLIRRVEAVNPTELAELEDIIAAAQAAEAYARQELAAENYTYDETLDRYFLVNGEELNSRFQTVYADFSAWLTRYEL